MRLTKKQRAQVVELLRCAADETPAPWLRQFAYDAFGYNEIRPNDATIIFTAIDAKKCVQCSGTFEGSYGDSCLEAAQLVEDGKLP